MLRPGWTRRAMCRMINGSNVRIVLVRWVPIQGGSDEKRSESPGRSRTGVLRVLPGFCGGAGHACTRTHGPRNFLEDDRRGRGPGEDQNWRASAEAAEDDPPRP